MDYKKTNATNTTVTRDLEEVTNTTGNIYHAISVMAKRSNQIASEIKEELTSKLEEFATSTDNLEEIFENREQIEISKFYERLPKAHSIALQELLEDKIYIRDPKDDAEEDAEESTEKAAKPMTDEEIALAEEAEAKKPMAPKSDEVTADADNTVDLNQAFSDLVSTVKSLQAEVEMLKSSKVDVEVAKESFEAVAKDIASATNVFNEFGKRVELVEQDTAFRKSGDLGEIVQDQPEMVEKSLWGGSFLKTTDLFK